jgi:RNA polymerase sigma-70 factor (ECF subfamily)
MEPPSDSWPRLELVGLPQGIGELEQKVTRLFEQLRDAVYRYLMVILDNPAEAEEMTQEAFLQLYRCLDGGQRISNLRAWIFRVAHNLALNQKGSAKRFVTLELAAWQNLSHLRQDPAPDPEEWVLEQEKAQKVRAALEELTSQQRQCLILRTEGFRYKEIAEILGIAVANVAQSVRRGIKKLTRMADE